MRMGFEKIRLTKDYHNIRVTDTFGDRTYRFRSKLEHRMAQHLEFLKTAGEIKDWLYETTTFIFPDDKYLVDFDILNNDGTFEYYEAKGRFEARDRRKLKLLFKYRPEVQITLVFPSMADAKRIKTSRKYIKAVCVLNKSGLKTVYSKAFDNKYNF